MVKSLRSKFVIVTTSLLVFVLGCFLLTITLYNNHWDDIEISGMLQWIAESGVFSMEAEANEEKDKELLTEELLEGENPIEGIILDKELHVLKKQVIGSGKDIQIPEDTLYKMCTLGNKKYKIGKYYYSYSETDDEHILLIVMDSSVNENLLPKILGFLGLALVAVFFLVLVTLWLSRFVTQPAEQSLLREKRFISDASHELKTPLGAISINAQAIKLAGEDSLYVNNIISESERMNRLIERLLTLARLDEEPTVSFENIDLSEVCEEMALTYESVAYEKKIGFSYEIKDGLIIKGNSDEMRQLIAILLDNAIKNTPEDGEMGLEVSDEKKQKRIIVYNTGKGISKNDLPLVFERFYSSNKARNDSSFGLGLAIAKAIVERHHGVIDVESIPDKKTVFSVLL